MTQRQAATKKKALSYWSADRAGKSRILDESVSNEHLNVYMNEFTFRYNRRNTPMAAFQTSLGLGVHQAPTTYRQIADQGPKAQHDLS